MPPKTTTQRNPKPFRLSQLECCKKRLEVRCKTRTGMLSQKLTAEQIARLAHTSVKNAYRWIENPSKIPRASWELLQIKALGLIPDPHYDGWRVIKGEIFTPDDKSFTLETLRHFQMVYNENRILRQELNQPRIEKPVTGRTRTPKARSLPPVPDSLPPNTVDFVAHAIRRGKMAP